MRRAGEKQPQLESCNFAGSSDASCGVAQLCMDGFPSRFEKRHAKGSQPDLGPVRPHTCTCITCYRAWTFENNRRIVPVWFREPSKRLCKLLSTIETKAAFSAV